MEASDAIELSGLCDTERSRALTRFEIIHPFLEDGCPEPLEIACVKRTDLKPDAGLTLAEGKMILNDLHQIVVAIPVFSQPDISMPNLS